MPEDNSCQQLSADSPVNVRGLLINRQATGSSSTHAQSQCRTSASQMQFPWKLTLHWVTVFVLLFLFDFFLSFLHVCLVLLFLCVCVWFFQLSQSQSPETGSRRHSSHSQWTWQWSKLSVFCTPACVHLETRSQQFQPTDTKMGMTLWKKASKLQVTWSFLAASSFSFCSRRHHALPHLSARSPSKQYPCLSGWTDHSRSDLSDLGEWNVGHFLSPLLFPTGNLCCDAQACPCSESSSSL